MNNLLNNHKKDIIFFKILIWKTSISIAQFLLAFPSSDKPLLSPKKWKLDFFWDSLVQMFFCWIEYGPKYIELYGECAEPKVGPTSL